MSVWNEIDAMQKRFDDELAAVKSRVYDVDKRAGNTVRMHEDGMIRLSYKGTEVAATTCAVLRQRFDELLEKERAAAEQKKGAA